MKLLPCPFCGGEVIESVINWNIACAECSKCRAQWGHCGSKYKGREGKWNTRHQSELKEIPGFEGTQEALDKLTIRGKNDENECN